MGDLVTSAVSGKLYYAGRSEFERVASSNAAPHERAALYADMARLNTLYMIATAGSGHIGSSFSSLDVVTWLYTEGMGEDDVYFSSKGHDAPGLYAVLTAQGVLDFENIHKLRRIDGLPGHPDVSVPGMVTNTGSLGMGISKAKGMAFARRLRGAPGRFYVMTGDGELQEGQIWESLLSAANHGLSEITCIVDHNKIQSDYSVERTSSLGDLEAKFAAFGWHVQAIDGHDYAALEAAFKAAADETAKPSVIIANTVKGKGVGFMEGVSIDSDVERFKFHSGAPQADDYTRAAQELIDSIKSRVARLSVGEVEFELIDRPAGPPPGETVRLFPAYTDALLDQAARNEKIVALDADLVLDMGLEPFREAFPERFIECGIAEMDMVSQAGGMALEGLLPVVNSFSCFLSTRPNEQIYNNATEHTKIVYVGGLSGVVPAGPGHSHQSLREISTLGSNPDFAVIEPACPEDVPALLNWALNTYQGSSFMRMVSVPYATAFKGDASWRPELGRGRVAREGGDVAIVASGLVSVAEALNAAENLARDGVSARIIAAPFLNLADSDWWADAVKGVRAVVTVDNHYKRYGLGDTVGVALAEAGALASVTFQRLGVETTPPCGSNPEVLDAVGLDAASIANAAKALL